MIFRRNIGYGNACRTIGQRRRGKRRRVSAIVPVLAGVPALVLLAGASRPARAQVAETPLLDQLLQPSGAGGGTAFQPGVTVTSRARPDYDSSGVQAGNFVIRPEIFESAGYESNVLGTARPHGSAVIETNASVTAASDWAQSSVRASLAVDDVRFPNQPQQSFTNWSADVSGSHEFGVDVATAGYSHLTLSQTPGGLDVPQLQQPLSYSIDSVRLGYRANFARTYLTPAVEVASYDFGSSLVQGTNYQQSYRNRTVVTPSLTAGYELSPRRNVIAVLRDSEALYSDQAAGLARRNYNDVAVLGGIDYDASSVIRTRLLAGYEIRTFQNASYKTLQAPIVEASVIWTPTGLTTVTGTLARRIQDSADETTAGYTESYAQLRVDHEYLPNVLLRANAGAYYTDYRSGGGNQALYTFGAGVTYLMSRNVQAGVSYDFTARDSGSTGNFGLLGTQQNFGSSYTDHRIVLQLRLRL